MGMLWDSIKTGLAEQRIQNKELLFGIRHYVKIKRCFDNTIENMEKILDFLQSNGDDKVYFKDVEGKMHGQTIAKAKEDVETDFRQLIATTILFPIRKRFIANRVLLPIYRQVFSRFKEVYENMELCIEPEIDALYEEGEIFIRNHNHLVKYYT